MGASVAQEFYKVRDKWASIDHLKSWKLAIWVAAFQDIDIIDKFMETERLPAGIFDDIFFRFDTEYKGDEAAFEKALWEEYKGWFEKPAQEKYDVYTALKNEGLLAEDYAPAISGQPTFAKLVKEMARFKASISGMDHTNFLLYFPPTRPDGPQMGQWFSKILEQGLPKRIRLATIDFAAQRKVKPSFIKLANETVMELHPKLNMIEAINNEMDKGNSTYDTVGADSRFRKQIRIVMGCTVEKSATKMQQEINKLVSVARELGTESAGIGALLIASQAWFALSEYKISEEYTDKAICKTALSMEANKPDGYISWRGCMLMKAAVLLARHKRDAAIRIYEDLAQTAAAHADPFYIMEAYRLAGQLYYEEGKMNSSFETLLLSIAAGGHLTEEVRRQSTFLHAAQLALYIGRTERTKAEVKTVQEQLENWLGNDWRELLDDEAMKKNTLKRKTPLFS